MDYSVTYKISSEDVEVVTNYDNCFQFQVDSCISGIYAINTETEGKTKYATTAMKVVDGVVCQVITNGDDIEKNYIAYSLNPTISCTFSYAPDNQIELYFNYGNYLNPKFTNYDLYKQSFLHLNSEHKEGILAIIGEYAQKYEMKGAYYLITNTSNDKPRFKIRKLTYEEKEEYLFEQSTDYSTDGKIDYISDNQHILLTDDEIEVTEDDFKNNDNLRLVGGNPIDFSIPIDPDDTEVAEHIDEYKYVYLECQITQQQEITGNIGITNSMDVTVDAELKWNSTTLGTLTGIRMQGYTSSLSATGYSTFYPIYLDFGTVVLSNYWTESEVGEESKDLVIDDVTIMHKVITATTTPGAASTYTVVANVDFSDSTKYLNRRVQKSTLGETTKIYGVFVITNGSGTLQGTLETLKGTIEKVIYIPEEAPDQVTGSVGGSLKQVDYDIKNSQTVDSSITKLFRMHDLKNMTLTTASLEYTENDLAARGEEKALYYDCIESSDGAYAVGTGYGYIDIKNAIFAGSANIPYFTDVGQPAVFIPISDNKKINEGNDILNRTHFLYDGNLDVSDNFAVMRTGSSNPTTVFDLPNGTLGRVDTEFSQQQSSKQEQGAGMYCTFIQMTDKSGYCESRGLHASFQMVDTKLWVEANEKDSNIVEQDCFVAVGTVRPEDFGKNAGNKKASKEEQNSTKYWSYLESLNGGNSDVTTGSYQKKWSVTELMSNGNKVIYQSYAVGIVDNGEVLYDTHVKGEDTLFFANFYIDYYDFGLMYVSVGESGHVMVSAPNSSLLNNVKKVTITDPQLLKKSYFNFAEISFGSQLTEIKCIFITDGFYDYISNEHTTMWYDRKSSKIEHGLVCNIVYEGNTSDVIVQIPMNIMHPKTLVNSHNADSSGDNYFKGDCQDFTYQIDVGDITNLKNGDANIGLSALEDRGISNTRTYQMYDGIRNSMLRSITYYDKPEKCTGSTKIYGEDDCYLIGTSDSTHSVKNPPPYSGNYDLHIVQAPLKNITYVFTKGAATEDIVKTPEKAIPYLFGTDNGIYIYDADEGTFTKATGVDGCYIHKIGCVKVSGKIIYIALVGEDGVAHALGISTDNGKTWEGATDNFLNLNGNGGAYVIDFTYVPGTSKLAILANLGGGVNLYYGNVVEKTVSTSDEEKE